MEIKIDETNRVEVKQNQNGLWYCTLLSVSCKDIMEGITTINTAMEKIEYYLAQRNSPPPISPKKKPTS